MEDVENGCVCVEKCRGGVLLLKAANAHSTDHHARNGSMRQVSK
jgi:hypothetical protein